MATGNIRSTRKLKQWMIEKVDSGKFPGLIWEDTDRTCFRIPWKHAGKQDFRADEDAALFKEWAIFKNKHKEGAKLEAAKWKTRLRCALNKSLEFAEVSERSQLDISEPYKVYRLVPPGEQNEKQVTGGKKRTLKGEARDVSSEDEMEPKKHSRSNHITMEVKDEGDLWASSSFYPEDSGIESSLNSPQRSSDSPQRDSGSPHRSFDSLQWSSVSTDRLQESTPDLAEVEANETPAVLNAGDHAMHVTIFYGGQQVFQKDIQNDCKISSTFPILGQFCTGMERISLPPANIITDPEKRHNTQELLTFLDKGIMLGSIPEGIYVERFCRGRVFWTGPCSPQPGSSKKLKKRDHVKLFDIEQFLTELKLYYSGQGPPPKYQVTLCFGEEITENDQKENKLITVQVEQIFARQQVPQDNFMNYLFFIESICKQVVSETADEQSLLW